MRWQWLTMETKQGRANNISMSNIAGTNNMMLAFSLSKGSFAKKLFIEEQDANNTIYSDKTWKEGEEGKCSCLPP